MGALLGLAVSPHVFAQGRVWYVNSAAEGANDGGNWPNAFNDLHDALAVAIPGDELWIAAGIYRPDRGTGNRLLKFLIPSGVHLFGGFKSGDASMLDRDPVKNQTILSGDLKGDDGADSCNDHSSCCIEHLDPGCDDAECEALVCQYYPNCCNPDPYLFGWIESCADFAKTFCCNLGNRNTCDNTLWIGEITDGMTGSTIDGISIEGVQVDLEKGSGGGLRILASQVTITGCQFRRNRGWCLDFPVEAVISNTVFEQNGIGVVGPIAKVSDSEFLWNNIGVWVPTRFNIGGQANIHRCTFNGNSSHALMLDSATAAIKDSVFAANHFAIELRQSAAEVFDCVFQANSAFGALISSSSVVIENSVFAENLSGAIDASESSVRVRNCALMGNRTHTGRGVVQLSRGGNLTVDHCTLFANKLVDSNFGIVYPRGIEVWDEGSRGLVRNSIVWGVPGNVLNNDTYLLTVQSGGVLEVNNSLVEGWTGRFGGEGNGGGDPLFVNPLGADGIAGTLDDDLRVRWGSPAIDAGAFISGLPLTDLDGHARVLCGFPDIGAYEFGIGDYDCNGTVDLLDFAAWPECVTGPRLGPYAPDCIPFDFNANQSIDMFDFSQFSRAVRPPPKLPQPFLFRDRLHSR